jgi:hypothetical protein
MVRALLVTTAAVTVLAGCTEKTALRAAEPVEVTLACYAPRLEEVRSNTRHYRPAFHISLGSTGRPDFTKAWAAEPTRCGEVRRHGGSFTAVEQRAYEASGLRDNDIAPIYRMCTEVDPGSPYLIGDFAPSTAQKNVFRAALILCPDHPHAGTWTRLVSSGLE